MKNDWIEVSTENLIARLPKDKAVGKCVIICELVNRKASSAIIKEVLTKEKNNNNSCWNSYLVSDYATAAMHLLGMNKYKGNKEEIIRLIAWGMNES